MHSGVRNVMAMVRLSAMLVRAVGSVVNSSNAIMEQQHVQIAGAWPITCMCKFA